MKEITFEQLNTAYKMDDIGSWYTKEDLKELANAELREKYPSAQDAWEKYHVILELCRNSENNK